MYGIKIKALLLLLYKDSPRSRGEMDVILSISFKITAEIEIRNISLCFASYFAAELCRLCIAYVLSLP